MTSDTSPRPVSPLRARMIEDMTVRGFNEHTRSGYAIDTGDVFVDACVSLGNNTDMAGLTQRYGITDLKPICGIHAPNKADPRQSQD
jgi:hypothetical protein